MTNTTSQTSDYSTRRAAFITAATSEVERAINAIRENGVRSYALAEQEDGSIEAFADGLRVRGTQFWTVEDEAAQYDSAEQYLDFWADAMRESLLEARDAE